MASPPYTDNAKANAKDVAKATHELGRTIVTLLLKEPFYGHLLGGLVRRVSEDVPTAAVALTSRGPELVINPLFFIKELNTKERVAVIKHEALHIIFRHLYRKPKKNTDPELFNIAADIVVNQLIAPWPLPETGVTLKTFPDYDLRPDQTVEWYYDKLLKLKKATLKLNNARTGNNGSGSSGSDEAENATQSMEALNSIRHQTTHSDHSLWAASGGASAADDKPISQTLIDALEVDIERHVIRARNRMPVSQWGSIPLSIQTELQSIEQSRKPKVDWRRTLRLFANSGYRTSLVPTNRRMSKRFNTFPGTRVKREKRVAVVIDTSGSISIDQLELFSAEIHGIWRNGADVHIIECDAYVQRTYPYKGKPLDNVQGGGGTSFDPAFEWLKNMRNGRFDACIYLTDGMAGEPEIRPRCPVMWVLTDHLSATKHLKFGRIITLPPA
ncbi:VWA-like domain-containing protein [Paracoccaceae bacterium]|nr:VWA-like domain-containing protein [Paracoccaceae bacterium]